MPACSPSVRCCGPVDVIVRGISAMSETTERIHLCDWASQPDLRIRCSQAMTTPAWKNVNVSPGVFRADNGDVYTFEDSKATCPACLGNAMTKCQVPPAGWYCTREAGHEGPCAAWPNKAIRFDRYHTETTTDGMSMSETSCQVPPTGWRCTRKRGHEGPCAAVPTYTTDDPLAVFNALVEFGPEGSVAAYVMGLINTLQRIVDWSDCRCEDHASDDCCAAGSDHDFHCPGCIAARALAQLP